MPDEAWEKVRAQFSEDEIKTLTLAITMINAWNRFNVAFRTVSGDYKPGMFRTVEQLRDGQTVRHVLRVEEIVDAR